MAPLYREIQTQVQYTIIDREKATDRLTCPVRTFSSCMVNSKLFLCARKHIPRMALSNVMGIVAPPGLQTIRQPDTHSVGDEVSVLKELCGMRNSWHSFSLIFQIPWVILSSRIPNSWHRICCQVNGKPLFNRV